MDVLIITAIGGTLLLFLYGWSAYISVKGNKCFQKVNEVKNFIKDCPNDMVSMNKSHSLIMEAERFTVNSATRRVVDNVRGKWKQKFGSKNSDRFYALEKRYRNGC